MNEDHAKEIVKMKMKIENAYNVGLTNRQMKASECGGYSLFSDNVGKGIQPRFNTGLSHKGSYLQMALTIGALNRVPSAHLSDIPLLKPSEVVYFPSTCELERIRGWLRFTMGKLISWYHPAFVKCGMFIKHPTITFAAFMKLKSDVSVVSLSVEDPASHDGMIRIVEKLITYLPNSAWQ